MHTKTTTLIKNKSLITSTIVVFICIHNSDINIKYMLNILIFIFMSIYLQELIFVLSIKSHNSEK